MFFVIIILYALWSAISLAILLTVLGLKFTAGLVGNTAPALGSQSTLLAVLMGLYAVNTAMITKQDLLFNTVGRVYECSIYDISYRFTHDDLGGPAYGILAKDFYNWAEPKYNAVWDYIIVGLENAANTIIGILPPNFASSYNDTWTTIQATFDFLIHVFRTPHSTSVPEISIPHLTVTVLDFIIDWITCWLTFMFNFVMSMSEVLFLGSCGSSCQALSADACACTKLTFGVISFFPSNGYIPSSSPLRRMRGHR